MKKKGWTMRKAILVFCIGCVLSALFLQTLLFQESLRRQIRFESITDNENTLTKMQSELSSFIHTIRSEMLTVYSERDHEGRTDRDDPGVEGRRRMRGRGK